MKAIMQIIPEKSKMEIPIRISGIDITAVSSGDGIVTIMSSAQSVEMTFSKTEYQTLSVPDFQGALEGTLKVDPDTAVIELRELPVDEARVLILDYITENHGAQTSDIIFDLELDVDLVLGILKEFYENKDIGMIEA